jgi:iron complex transport system permease protein
VQAELLQEYPETTPVAVCYHLTWPDERIFRGELKDLARIVKENNLLLLGDGYARNLGLNIKRARLLVISCSGVLVAIVTAYCGPIMFIGLTVPHLCRAIFHTSDHRILMPATLLVGAALALVCNLIARMPGFEGALPVNSVTALVGAPVVASVLFRKRKGELNE